MNDHEFTVKFHLFDSNLVLEAHLSDHINGYFKCQSNEAMEKIDRLVDLVFNCVLILKPHQTQESMRNHSALIRRHVLIKSSDDRKEVSQDKLMTGMWL